MSQKNTIRDTTSQIQRDPKALKKDYVLIDERTDHEFREWAREFAEMLQFYNQANKREGDWSSFFPEGDWENDEMISTTFFKMFQHIFQDGRDFLNSLTQRHLDFYYRKILQLKEKQAVMDRVHVGFGLSGTSKNARVEEGTLLLAGKDALGKDLFYKTNSELVVNRATIGEIRSVFKDLEQNELLLKAPVANSGDGLGGDFINNQIDWTGFGESQKLKKEGEETMINSAIGLAIASPILLLNEGNRKIAFQFEFLEEISNFLGLENLEEGAVSQNNTDLFWWESFGKYSERVFANSCVCNAISSSTENKGCDCVTGVDLPENYWKLNLVQRLLTKVKMDIFFSGEEDWLGPFTLTNENTSIIGNKLQFSIDISEDMPAIVAYNSEVIEGGFNSNWPMMKMNISVPVDEIALIEQKIKEKGANSDVPVHSVAINPQSNELWRMWKFLQNDVFSKLMQLPLKETNICVRVEGVKNLTLQNDQTIVDPGKPFAPFGQTPIIGSNFYIGNSEVFQKQLDFLKVNINWYDLPLDGLTSYYDSYVVDSDVELPSTGRTNDAFKTEFELLQDKKWSKLKAIHAGDESIDVIQCFEPISDNTSFEEQPNLFGTDDDNKLTHESDIRLEISNGKRKPNSEFDPVYGQDTIDGYLKMNLNAVDFGHGIYPSTLTKKTLLLNKAIQEGTTIDLPNLPYTPTIENISLDYVSSVRLNHETSDSLRDNETNYSNRLEQFFHIGAFGQGEIHGFTHAQNLGKNFKTPFLPSYIDEGNLYMGIADLEPPINLSILFQVAEGSADPEQRIEEEELNWWYMSENQWKPFSNLNILSDSTKGLVTSGIVVFQIPEDATKGDPWMNNESYFWIRASVRKNTLGAARFIGLKTQMVEASFIDSENDPYHLASALDPDQINAFADDNSSFSEVIQPYSSFGGQIKEQNEGFYTRISERLRHKQRAINVWDFERLVLEKFPSIYQVKCLAHTDRNTDSKPGSVIVLVIPNVRNKKGVNLLAPKTDYIELLKIENYLKQFISPFVKLEVRNPIYQEIKMDFKVKFRPGYDEGFYGQQLNTDIIRYLSPWLYDDAKDVQIGGKIYKSAILEFIELLPYVDYLTDFKFFQLVRGIGFMHVVNDATSFAELFKIHKDTDVAFVPNNQTILISAKEHKIEIIKERVN